jgi:hypothetical protein
MQERSLVRSPQSYLLAYKVEVLKVGFPITYCTNPELAAPTPPLQPKKSLIKTIKTKLSRKPPPAPQPQVPAKLNWVPNIDRDQIQASYLCTALTLQIGQDALSVTLPCSLHEGDSGGAAYVVVRDRQFPGNATLAYAYNENLYIH